MNAGGRIGAFLADIFLSVFGGIAYVLPPLVVFAAWLGVRESSEDDSFKTSEFVFKLTGFILIVLSSCGLVNLYLPHIAISLPAHAGGILGDVVATQLMHVLNSAGTTLSLMTALLCGITLFAGISWLGLIDALGIELAKLGSACNSFLQRQKSARTQDALEPTLERLAEKIKKPVKSSWLSPKVVEPKIIDEACRKTVRLAPAKVDHQQQGILNQVCCLRCLWTPFLIR